MEIGCAAAVRARRWSRNKKSRPRARWGAREQRPERWATGGYKREPGPHAERGAEKRAMGGRPLLIVRRAPPRSSTPTQRSRPPRPPPDRPHGRVSTQVVQKKNGNESDPCAHLDSLRPGGRVPGVSRVGLPLRHRWRDAQRNDVAAGTRRGIWAPPMKLQPSAHLALFPCGAIRSEKSPHLGRAVGRAGVDRRQRSHPPRGGETPRPGRPTVCVPRCPLSRALFSQSAPARGGTATTMRAGAAAQWATPS